MAGRLQDKVAVITGGANGIGRATALRFLDEGAAVIIADYNETTAHETLDLAAAAGHAARIRFIRTDVTQEDQVAAAIALGVSTFGRLDCVFNNAGIGGAFGPLTHITAEDWDHTFAVLTRGVFFGLKHGARTLKAQGQGGSMINTASIAAFGGANGPQAYSAAKAGVISLTQAAAVELGPARIRVNAICPGLILTPIQGDDLAALAPIFERAQPLPEIGCAEHVAAVALFLASEDAHFVTGTAVVVDGGLTAAGPRTVQVVSGDALTQAYGLLSGSTGQPSKYTIL
ncbi:MAG: 2,5-dichloro-2,5-cyclohexadiene-1,4-diol dehydrogenase (2,5-ddol dehydrogenase) [Deltaproteobacteria bacterium]|jgi:NAD(P)-dependent dehydrogenase (short-subunit alcohol dehydrogenase family)|nr:2,5-dichloro-2,5-cyclohexadiene-1,4-diol dehydrogenase (2,5-ddol dehydrogenase) [Deltaproteobacteria bacterium]